MKWRYIGIPLAAIAVIAEVCILGCMHRGNSTAKPAEKWPATTIRDNVKNLVPTDIKTVVFLQFPGKKGLERKVVTDPKLIAEFLSGLQNAVWPCSPDALPGNRTYEVELHLKNGTVNGPYAFAVESNIADGWRHAFSKGFATAFNKLGPRTKIRI